MRGTCKIKDHLMGSLRLTLFQSSLIGGNKIKLETRILFNMISEPTVLSRLKYQIKMWSALFIPCNITASARMLD